MFAVQAMKPVALAKPLEGLSRLSSVHKDGWGVARFGSDGWAVDKDLLPANQTQRFAELCNEQSGPATLAHIRLSTVGAVDTSNNHPFVSNGWVFMHNGTLANFETARAKLENEIAPEFRAALQGATDSERCFALFLTFLQGRADVDVSEAARAMSRVSQLAASICDDTASMSWRRSSMNFVASNGKMTVATRKGQTLFTNVGNDAHSIASTDLYPGEWKEVAEGGILVLDDRLGKHESRILDWK